jgi:MFS family permease
VRLPGNHTHHAIGGAEITGVTDHRQMSRFAALVISYSASTCGNFLNLIALNLYVYQVTGSAIQTGMLMALRLAAGFLAGPVAGVLATRYDRRRMMVTSDVVQALAMLVLVVSPATLHERLVYGVAVILGVGNTVFLVALRSSVPEMVGADLRVRANGYLVTGKAVGMVTGYVGAGLVIEWLGFAAAFVVNGASFVVSAVVVAWLPLRFRSGDRDEATPAGLGHPVHAVRILYTAVPGLLAMVTLRGVDAFGSASHNVAFPLFAQVERPDDPALFLSQFWVCWAVGSLTAGRLMARPLRNGDHSWEERAFAVAASVMSIGFVGGFLGLPLPLLMLTAVIAGLADGCTEVIYTSRLQAVHDDLRGSVFGLSTATETLGFASGMLASSVLLEALPAPSVVALFHGMVISAVVVFLLQHRTRRRIAGAPGGPVHDSAPGRG